MGAENRLDFTVIGPVVNLAFRLEALTKKLARPIIVSAAFAAACPDEFEGLGVHGVGHSGETEKIFAPSTSSRCKEGRTNTLDRQA